MKLKTSTWIIIAANVWWTGIVVLSMLILFSSSYDSMEGAGFLLVFAGLPSSMLVMLFPQGISVGMQMFLMAIFGYMQYNLAALLLGLIIGKSSK